MNRHGWKAGEWTVTLGIAAMSLAFPGPAHAQSVADWRPCIVEASDRFGIPGAWIERVMQVESGGRTTLGGRPIRSSAGAMGLMQLMPATWADMRGRLGLGADPDDPHDNILAGTFYLRLMYDRFGYPGLFAAYNAGPGRYAAYLAGRAHLPSETIAYLASVAPSAPRHAPTPAHPTPPPLLFVVRRALEHAEHGAMTSPAASLLFIALSKVD